MNRDDFITVPKDEYENLKQKVDKLTTDQHDKEVIRDFIKNKVARPLIWIIEKLVFPIAVAVAAVYLIK